MTINILDYIEEAAYQYPDRYVFIDPKNKITYKNLLEQAQVIGTNIRRYGSLENNEKNRPIVVFIDRNIESLILFMGVIYSGNFYIPVDFNLPVHRINLIIETLNPALLLSSKDVTMDDKEILIYSELVKGNADKDLLLLIRQKMLDVDPLYSIFTSGTTGMPKGVLVSHRSVIDLVEQFSDTFHFPDYPVFGNQAPFDFDVSVKDIYNCLKEGGTVVIIPKQYFVLPSNLISFLNEYKVNVIIWAVSAMRIVQNFNIFKKNHPVNLRIIMFSGEVMPIKCLNYWREEVPDAQFVNLYGPTEITCNCNYYIVDRDFTETQCLPIGKSFRNTEVFLVKMDENKLIEEKDVVGEICVRGSCLALGYYNNRERTAEAFVQNPMHNLYTDLVYKTGDLGKYDQEGSLYFVSRKDNQVKHMGHRIELGEIEVAANSLKEIEMACCIYDSDKEKIILCYQACHEADSLIKDRLSEILPRYMMPGIYLFYKDMPLNEHGKVNRQLLINENIE